MVLVQRQGKLGLGAAYRAGIHAAKGNWIVLMDADLSHHPKYLGAFLGEMLHHCVTQEWGPCFAATSAVSVSLPVSCSGNSCDRSAWMWCLTWFSGYRRLARAPTETQRTTGADIVTGTRYRTGGGVYGWTTSRRVVSNGANILAQTLLMPGVSDLTGSYR